MPEGDTIFNVAAVLRPLLVGRPLVDAWLRTGGHDRLIGRVVVSVEAQGKHLFINLDDGLTVRSHLGMYGSWHRYALAEPWRKPQRRASLVLRTATDVLVCFQARAVELMPTQGVSHRAWLGRLGPDLAAARPDLPRVSARAFELLPAETPLVDVLLDQRVACGIGNVYKSETLFLSRLHPATSLGGLNAGALEVVFGLAHDLLRRNLGRGPRKTRWVEGGEDGLWVYGRWGERCFVCGAPIRCAPLGRSHRVTYWCDRCQPAVSGMDAFAGITQ